MFGQIERFINSFNHKDVMPNLSSLARYCEDTDKFLDLSHAILEEICAGSQGLGIFGSREMGTNDPESDVDVASLHNWLWLKDKALHRGQLRPIVSTRYRDPRFPTGEEFPWIHITRVPTDFLSLGERGCQIIQDTRWFWFRTRDIRNEVAELRQFLRKATPDHPKYARLYTASMRFSEFQP